MLMTFAKRLCIASLVVASVNVHATESPTDLVYPYLDTANSRWFFFDSASLPFGMVNLSPDTELGGAWGSGYRYNSEEIKGFSHVHAWQLSGLSVMPVSSDTPLKELKNDYYSSFSHEKEQVRPGYHQVYLNRYNINVELTATTRVGLHKIQYPANQAQQFLFQLGGQLGPSELGHAEIHQQGSSALSGFITNKATFRRPRPTKVYFYAQFNQDIDTLTAWRKEQIFEHVSGIDGEDAGVLVNLKGQAQATLLKVGISYVSEHNAKANIDAELAHWQFEQVKQQADATWNKMLSQIEISGGTENQRRRFYTDLWHALQGRRIISDANGQYMDQTASIARVGQLPLDPQGKPKFNQHNSDSFWGAQWTISTLWPLAYPKVASDFTNSLLQYYRDGGQIPRGPSGGNYTYVMTGASSTPFIVSNYMKGIRDFDIDLAYQGLQHSHSAQGMMARAGYEHYSLAGGGMSHYLDKGYVPYPLPENESNYGNHRRGTGMTLEYAFQDHALAQFAKALGHDKDYAYYSKRAQNYRHVFDAESGFMRSRNADGSWQTPFDPYLYENGFVESNPAQGTWFVPHDIQGLAELMGGNEVLIQRLDDAFKIAEKQEFTSGKAHAHEANADYSRTPINYGNQPSMQTAFIFSAAGAPWKTQYWSRKVVDTVYADLSPDFGYNGDEDQGLMGSLSVLMKIGLFQLTGGTEVDPIYWIGSPQFERIDIHLDQQYYSGRTFSIVATGNNATSPYIKAIKLNGLTLSRTYLRHSEIVQGGVLELTMSDTPNTSLK
ncbi:MAG: GH92 family glycosyl hydrolase [Paraglaciecola sp.]|nr:GH92 family glycosyl hydrolase [Paraglaciecola sp.]